MPAFMTRLLVVVAAGLLTTAVSAQEKAEKLTADKLPAKVLEVMKARFPGAVYTSITKETAEGKVIYDLEFKHKDRKTEMDIREDGTIINIEREVAAKDVPKPVLAAVEKKYPKAALKEIMEIMEMKDNKEVLEGYEVVFVSADKKNVELMISPDGKIIEEEVDGKKILEKN